MPVPIGACNKHTIQIYSTADFACNVRNLNCVVTQSAHYHACLLPGLQGISALREDTYQHVRHDLNSTTAAETSTVRQPADLTLRLRGVVSDSAGVQPGWWCQRQRAANSAGTAHEHKLDQPVMVWLRASALTAAVLAAALLSEGGMAAAHGHKRPLLIAHRSEPFRKKPPCTPSVVPSSAARAVCVQLPDLEVSQGMAVCRVYDCAS